MSRSRRLTSLKGQSRPRGEASQPPDYWHALSLTHRAGLAQLRHYEVTMGHAAGENREVLCTIAPLLAALARRSGESVSGLGAVGAFPPGKPLPSDLQADLDQFEEVARATGTQLLEMRRAGGARAAEFSPAGRLERATMYLALGDAQGNAVRDRVWQGRGSAWRVSDYAVDLTRKHGLTRREYDDFRTPWARWLPSSASPKVQRKRREPSEETTKGADSGRLPWISYFDMIDLIGGWKDLVL